MEYEASIGEKLFKNSSLRNTFCRNVIEAFEAERENYAGLVSLYSSYAPMLQAMDNSPEEYDQLAAGNLRARYDAIIAGIKESREWVNQLKVEWEERELMK
jgi:hypothetical protein